MTLTANQPYTCGNVLQDSVSYRYSLKNSKIHPSVIDFQPTRRKVWSDDARIVRVLKDAVRVCITQRHKSRDTARSWAQRLDLWRSDGHRQSRRQAIILTATLNLRQLQRTESQWTVWRLDPATRSQCGLSAGRNLSVTTSPALIPQVCVGNFSYVKVSVVV